MMLVLHRAALLIAVLLLGSCASNFEKFFQPAQGATPEVVAQRRAGPPPESPAVERSAPVSPSLILDAYLRRGYVMIGHSAFNSGREESENDAVALGTRIGADIVLILNPRYTGSVTSQIPITVPKTTTSYSSGNATAYGPSGTVNAYGNSTTTTYGTQTTYIPTTVNRSDYAAVYFVKTRTRVGVIGRDLNDEERRALETNRGMAVVLIVDNSPAFDADILPGDFVIALNGVPVANTQDYQEKIGQLEGQQISITLVRNGERIEKQIVSRSGP